MSVFLFRRVQFIVYINPFRKNDVFDLESFMSLRNIKIIKKDSAIGSAQLFAKRKFNE